MDLKELNKIIQLCRKNGIETIEIGNIKLRFNADLLPRTDIKQNTVTKTNPVYSPGGITEDSKIETEELTEDQLLYWSTGGAPQ